MGDLFQPTHLLVIGVIVFLLFGAKRLPELGKGLGEGIKGFKEGIKGVSEPTAAAPPVYQQTVQTVQQPVPQPLQQVAQVQPPVVSAAPVEPK